MAARAEAAQASQARVLDVALELFTDKPYDDVSLDEIATTAGVTKRTVLRQFGTKGSLLLAANERGGREEMRRREVAPVGDVRTAVELLVASYERFGLNRLRMLAQEDRIPIVARDAAEGRRLHVSWVERTFAPLIGGLTGAARKRRIVALVALTDVYMWKLLRLDHGLSRGDTERVLIELIGKVEGAP
jgi:AcrR family transcriptional regulator